METYLSPAQKYKVVRRLKVARGHLGKVTTRLKQISHVLRLFTKHGQLDLL